MHIFLSTLRLAGGGCGGDRQRLSPRVENSSPVLHDPTFSELVVVVTSVAAAAAAAGGGMCMYTVLYVIEVCTCLFIVYACVYILYYSLL